MAKITFANKNRQFHLELKSAVEKYFQEHKLKPTGNFTLYFKSLFFIGGTITLYVLMLAFNPAWYIVVPMALLMGVLLAGIGFNVMHDANHGSYSNIKWVNELLGLSLNALGGNAFLWKQKHNIVHHTYTNIEGVDDDIFMPPFLRMSPHQKRYKLHKYQHLYMFLMYSISSVAWIWYQDFSKYFAGKILVTELKKMDWKEHSIFWLTKSCYIGIYIVLPIACIGFLKFLLAYVCLNVALSLVLTTVFQLAHVVEHNEFVAIDHSAAKAEIENDWAIHQVETTADFATSNRLVSWFLGGLNFQVIHHLFPRVSHVHYPRIQHIIVEVCKKYGIPYKEYNTVYAAVRSHVSMMRQLGRND